MVTVFFLRWQSQRPNLTCTLRYVISFQYAILLIFWRNTLLASMGGWNLKHARMSKSCYGTTLSVIAFQSIPIRLQSPCQCTNLKKRCKYSVERICWIFLDAKKRCANKPKLGRFSRAWLYKAVADSLRSIQRYFEKRNSFGSQA